MTRLREIAWRTVLFAVLEGLVLWGIWYLRAGLSVQGQVFHFSHPERLYAMLVIPVLVLMPTLSDLPLLQRALAFILRFSALALVTMAAAVPYVSGEIRKVSVVALLDTSKSVGTEGLREQISRLKKTLPSISKFDLHIATYGSHFKIINNIKELAHIKPNGKFTDLETALRWATGFIPPENDGRIIVMGDGLETRGHAASVLDHLRSAGIRVYHAFVSPTRPPEVFVQSVEAPQSVELRRRFEMKVTLVSTRKGKARLFLYQGSSPEELVKGGVQFTADATLIPGPNIVKFTAMATSPGINAFKVVARPTPDTDPNNNTAWAVVQARKRPKVLYVEARQSQGRDLAQALRAGGIDVEVRSAWGFPESLIQMRKYVCIIQSDVPAYRLTMSQMRNLEEYVKHGGCYIMSGGPDSFGSGGYVDTPIERVLPVRFDLEKNKMQPSVALALVIDRSGSMEGIKLRLAVEAAALTTKTLNPKDLITVIAFDDRPTVVVPITYAANRSRIDSQIHTLRSGGGTAIVPALDRAVNTLCETTARVKHVILLSDGQSPWSGLTEVMDNASSCRITVSAIGIGSDVDRRLMVEIARQGNGRVYFTNNPNELPRIFVREASKVARPPVMDEPFRPKVTGDISFLEGLNLSRAPYLLGYVPVKPKPKAHVVLAVDTTSEPLLVWWNYGRGRAIAWTSDVKARWARRWLEAWPQGFSRFWTAVLRHFMRVKRLEQYRMTIKRTETGTRIIVDAASKSGAWRNFLEGRLKIDGFGFRYTTTVNMRQSAPGRYETTISLPHHGTYALHAVFSCDPDSLRKKGLCPAGQCMCSRKGDVGEAFGYTTYSYDREDTYLQPPAATCLASKGTCPGLNLLQLLSSSTGGDALPGDIRAPGRRKVIIRKDMWQVFLYPVFLLLAIELLLRRIRLWG